MIVKSLALRRFAEGRDCSLRLQGCSFNPEQTVLAHLPCMHSGMAMKGLDTVAVLACMNCHDLIDGRRDPEFVLEAPDACRALAETHLQMIQAGLLIVKGAA